MDGGFEDPNMMGGPMPQQQPMMPQDPGMQPVEGGNEEGQSVYDTNFDAGVEADEDTDPKKYIQQLTGKLSTTLNSYNNEQGDDEGLNKYVGKMIIKQAAKHMSDADKKELIKAINTASEPDEDEVEPEDGEGQ